jgi:hypothetical protein
MSDIKSMKLYTHVERIVRATSGFTVKQPSMRWTIFIALSSKTFSRVNWAGYASVPNG